MKRFTIGMILPDGTDATSFYRGMGPWTALFKENPEILFIMPTPPFAWNQLKMCNMLFMQRPCMPEHWHLLIMAKEHGIPVWVDFDDDNLSVPKSNPMYHHYAQPAVKDAIVNISRHCDVLTVSTDFMQKKYGIYNKNTYVIPNAIDDDVLRIRCLPTTPRNKMFLWRGTVSHIKNIYSFTKEIVDTGAKYPEWRWGFVGMDPLDITDHLKNFQAFGQTAGPYGVHEFYRLLMQIHATALYYVLDKTDHSQARSHVAWLEGTYANAACILPEHPEFKRPGTINFANPTEFVEKLEMVAKGEVDIDKHVNESWQCIQEKYMLSKTNLLRKQILDQFMK